VRVLTVADRHIEYAKTVVQRIKEKDLVCDLDASQESINKKVRNAQLLKTNYIFIVGDQEVANQSISLRTRDNVVHGEIDIVEFLAKVVKERDERTLSSPFSQNS